jgi:serine/threonine protein kinase
MTRLADDRTVTRDDALARAAEAVAEGRPVDWSALGAVARGPEALQQLENLRVIGDIAGVHRAGDHHTSVLDAPHAVDGSQPPPPGAGEPWGRFRLLEMVGSGSFGGVYRAWDPDLEREVAIKILHRRVADEELKSRLLREGRALAKLRHDNVVTVLGVESYEDRIGLCMEFVRGATLEASMHGGHRLNPREAVLVGQDVCRALAAVHAAGFVHRDVTARNIMRDVSGRIVLMDFGTGFETAGDGAAVPAKIAGTPMYMAPEVLAGQPASPCSDVYSVGVLLYYLVTGKFPVEGRTMDELRGAHMVGRRTSLVERAPDLPAQYVQAVENALAANPQQRCPSAGALLQALDVVLARKHTRSGLLLLALETVVGVVVVVTALGAINSRYFNHVLGRTDFANESVLKWLSVGVSATIAPTVVLLFTLFAIGLVSVVARLLLTMSSTARGWRTSLEDGIRRCRLDDVSTLSACVLLISAMVLIATWWYFIPFLDSLGAIALDDISSASRESLAFLSPQFRDYHWLYRKSFTAVVIACFALWYPAVWLSVRKGEPISRGILAGGVAVILLSLLLLDFPYRLLAQHKREFDAVRMNSDPCFILGERQAHLLLFCPQADVPRNRIVRADDPNLKRLGFVQDIFTDVGKPK